MYLVTYRNTRSLTLIVKRPTRTIARTLWAFGESSRDYLLLHNKTDKLYEGKDHLFHFIRGNKSATKENKVNIDEDDKDN